MVPAIINGRILCTTNSEEPFCFFQQKKEKSCSHQITGDPNMQLQSNLEIQHHMLCNLLALYVNYYSDMLQY